MVPCGRISHSDSHTDLEGRVDLLTGADSVRMITYMLVLWVEDGERASRRLGWTDDDDGCGGGGGAAAAAAGAGAQMILWWRLFLCLKLITIWIHEISCIVLKIGLDWSVWQFGSQN